MKIRKPFIALLLGTLLLVWPTGVARADEVALTGFTLGSLSPVCFGTTPAVVISAGVTNLSGTNCELTITNQVWSWTNSGGGTCSPPDGTGGTNCNGYYTTTLTNSTNFTATVIQITSQCLATTPTNLARLTIGVCEEVILLLTPSPSGTVAWTLSGGGTLNGSGNSADFIAPDTGQTCTITATASDCSCSWTKTFTVVAPSGVGFVKLGEKHTQGWIDAGFHAQCIILDTNVSFYNIQISELHATYTADGCFLWQNGHIHPTWSEQSGGGWLTPGQNNYLNTRVDYTYTFAKPTSGPGPGTVSCPIPWNYRALGTTNDGYYFATLTSSADATASGVCTKSKNRMNSTPFNISDTTVKW